MDEPQYEISREDILIALRFLRLTVPQHATPEKAIYLLDYCHRYYEKLEELSPEAIEVALEDFESH